MLPQADDAAIVGRARSQGLEGSRLRPLGEAALSTSGTGAVHRVVPASGDGPAGGKDGRVGVFQPNFTLAGRRRLPIAPGPA